MPYADLDQSERMSVALIGTKPDREGELFMDRLADRMSVGTIAFRAFRTHGQAPVRLRGTVRLTTRAQSSGRRVLELGEARGYGPPFPFKPTFIKSGQSVRRALHHGYLVVERGFNLALIPSSRTRRTTPSDWPRLSPSGWAHRSINHTSTGMPLVVGASSASGSWELLSRFGSLAVWCGSWLWTFLVLQPPFPAPLDELRRQASGIPPKKLN